MKMKNNKLYFITLILIVIAIHFNSNINAMNMFIPNMFIPIPKVRRTKKFTPEEDERLRNAMHKYTNKNAKKIHCWDKIAKEVGGDKTIKQCEKRWYDYLSTEDIEKPWTKEQEMFLLEKQRELGNKWSIIAKLLKDKSTMSVKNKFHCLSRKQKQSSFLNSQQQDQVIVEDSIEFSDSPGHQFDDDLIFDGNFTSLTDDKFPDFDDFGFKIF